MNKKIYTNIPTPAIEVYQNAVYSILLANRHPNVDIYIISAKYGVITADTLILPYNLFFEDLVYEQKKDEYIAQLKKVLELPYKEILVNAGGNYKKLFETIVDDRIKFCDISVVESN
jgi:cytoplasmic iron level regulating protein YaaA (DUF328/UPF0246 family)